MSLARIIDRIDRTSWKPSRTTAAQKAIVEYTRAEITRETAERDLLKAGWSPDQVRKILSSADRNLILVRRS